MNKKEEIQKEILDSIGFNESGRLIVAPRVGKTKIAIDIIKRDKPNKILWVTPSRELANTDIPNELKKWKAFDYIDKIKFTTWKSLVKEVGHYDLIILDEEQFITENNASNLISNKLTGRIISMTGTQTKTFVKNTLYNSLRLKILYKMSINNAVDLELLSNYKIKVIMIDMNTEVNTYFGKNKKVAYSEEGRYKFLDNLVAQSMFLNKKFLKFHLINRLNAIKNSPSKREAAEYLKNTLKGRKLIFCPNIETAQSLSKNTYHSKTDNNDLKKFINGEIDEIAMVNAGGIGFTYKEVDNLILMQIDSDKTGISSQKIARVLLHQPNYEATIYILCLKGTQDEKWLDSVLSKFDSKKIEYLTFLNLKNENKP